MHPRDYCGEGGWLMDVHFNILVTNKVQHFKMSVVSVSVYQTSTDIEV